MDNAPCHHRARGFQLPRNHQIHYLPPYSLFLNVAKNSFSVWKAGFKREMAEVPNELTNSMAENQTTLIQLTQQNLAHVTADNCAAYVRAIAWLTPRMLNREDIMDITPNYVKKLF